MYTVDPQNTNIFIEPKTWPLLGIRQQFWYLATNVILGGFRILGIAFSFSHFLVISMATILGIFADPQFSKSRTQYLQNTVSNFKPILVQKSIENIYQ